MELATRRLQVNPSLPPEPLPPSRGAPSLPTDSLPPSSRTAVLGRPSGVLNQDSSVEPALMRSLSTAFHSLNHCSSDSLHAWQCEDPREAGVEAEGDRMSG